MVGVIISYHSVTGLSCFMVLLLLSRYENLLVITDEGRDQSEAEEDETTY